MKGQKTNRQFTLAIVLRWLFHRMACVNFTSVMQARMILAFTSLKYLQKPVQIVPNAK